MALGVLSSAGDFETGRASAQKNRLMRARVREAASRSGPASQHGIVLRFVIASFGSGQLVSSLARSSELRLEAERYDDFAVLNMTERFYLCAMKHIHWYRYASAAFPSVAFFAVADNDAYVQIAHLAADLRSVQAQMARGVASPLVLYGLILWKPYFNAVSHEPAGDFGGWGCRDAGAARARRKLERCAAALLRSNGTARAAQPLWLLPGKGPDAGWDEWAVGVLGREKGCAKLQRAQRRALLRMDASPPFPFANGPLFALSRALGELTASSGVAEEWLAAVEATHPVRSYRKTGGHVPFTLRGSACYPSSFDALNGRWAYELARRSGFALNITLVNTPFMVQHHPWFARSHGSFSNASIVLHELKNPNSPGWAFAAARGSGPFEPWPRSCASCAAKGWSSDAASPLRAWTCCGLDGSRERRAALRRAGRAPDSRGEWVSC